ncbi:MAG TPA: hypothetical protein VGG64_07990 [Pirellulales bacterium]|jgi:hypothetical protein
MLRLVLIFPTHLVLLVFASTSYTILAGRADALSWQYFRVAFVTGFGQPYQSSYTLPVVITYALAYGLGCLAYLMLFRSGSKVLGRTGLALCLLGVASFTFEGTHWLSAHHRSLIVSFPGVVLALGVAVTIMLLAQKRGLVTRTAGESVVG